MTAVDSGLLAAIFTETVETLRERAKTAADNAADHRTSARHHQELADREALFAARDEERARQWSALLEVAEEMAAPSDEAAQETWAAQREAAVDEVLDARDAEGVSSTWADPAVRRAVRETIAESEGVE